MTLEIYMVHADHLEPNPWNPNEMTPEMMEKERASIREFGFIDPLTVRKFERGWQIIDGEQRFEAAMAEEIEAFPCIVLDVDEDEARELTIILNDTRGQFQEDKLSRLVQDLASRRDAARMERLLPYDRSRLEQLSLRREIDWEKDFEQRRSELDQQEKERDTDPWVERVYRMPRSSAQVLDDAIERVQRDDGVEHPWRALEMIAADFLAG